MRHALQGRGRGAASWVVLLGGRGRLDVDGARREIRAPTWLSAPGGRWSFEGDGTELVAIEFSLPRFDARLFARAMIPGMDDLLVDDAWSVPSARPEGTP